MRSARRPAAWRWQPLWRPAVARRCATPAAVRRRRWRSQSGTPDETRGPRSASLPDGRRRLSGMLDGRADAGVGPAAADVAGHRRVDVGVRGMRLVRQQRDGGHNLAGLAVAALHDLEIKPGLLDLPATRRAADGLDRSDVLTADPGDRRDAGADRLAGEVDRAGAAECGATAELRPGQADHVSQDPEQGHVRWRIDPVSLAVDSQYDHEESPFADAFTRFSVGDSHPACHCLATAVSLVRACHNQWTTSIRP